MSLSILVESGGTKTDVAIYDPINDVVVRKDQFKTPQTKDDFIKGFWSTIDSLIFNGNIEPSILTDLQLSSAGTVTPTHIITTNSGGLEYDIADIEESLSHNNVHLRSYRFHNDMAPGTKSALSYFINKKGEIEIKPRKFVEMLHQATEPVITNNMIYTMPGTGYGVSQANEDDGKHHIVCGELGHLQVGEAKNQIEKELFQYIKQHEKSDVEYEHLVGGKYLHHIFEFATSQLNHKTHKKDLDELVAQIKDPEKAAPIFSEAADKGNQIAVFVMDTATRIYVRSLIDYVNVNNAGIVVSAGNLVSNSKYAQSHFEELLMLEASQRVHEKNKHMYTKRVNYVLLSDTDNNMNGLKKFAQDNQPRSRYKEDGDFDEYPNDYTSENDVTYEE